MTQTPHDSFAKKYLSDLFVSSGKVKPGREVYGETQQVDLWFEPMPNAIPALRTLGTLGQIASTFCLIEPFRNAVQVADVQNCVGKLFNVYAELRRKAKREKISMRQVVLPKLWLITPTASTKVLLEFGATEDIDWGRGIYFTATQFHTAFVVLHQVPATPDNLWLRLMGRGSV